MISKELLSEVLSLNVLAILKTLNGEVYYLFDESCGNLVSRETKINIYELAHKCKEWAWDRGYCIMPSFLFTPEDPNDVFEACIEILENKELKDDK